MHGMPTAMLKLYCIIYRSARFLVVVVSIWVESIQNLTRVDNSNEMSSTITISLNSFLTLPVVNAEPVKKGISIFFAAFKSKE